MGKAYENAMREYGKQTGKSGLDLTKAYQEYTKAAGQLASDTRELYSLKVCSTTWN
jgi:hypothetical protein